MGQAGRHQQIMGAPGGQVDFSQPQALWLPQPQAEVPPGQETEPAPQAAANSSAEMAPPQPGQSQLA